MNGQATATLRPGSKQELARVLAEASRHRQPVHGVDLSALNQVLWHTPEDMTVKVQTGITVAQLQEIVGRHGQWLPIDPPHAESLTIAELLASNVSGPRRFAFGTIRDHLIGLQVALPDGKLASSGGNVVKNVAGYDLMKLFVGARNSLGFPVEATFKLLPRPEAEAFVQGPPEGLAEVDRRTAALLDSELVPMVLDWHGRLDGDSAADRIRLVLGFAGTRDEVEWQTARAAALGFGAPAGLDYERDFWKGPASAVHSLSVLPSNLAETIRGLGVVPFIARAGNGVVYYASPSPASALKPDRGEMPLARRLKDIFDPAHILPQLSA